MVQNGSVFIFIDSVLLEWTYVGILVTGSSFHHRRLGNSAPFCLVLFPGFKFLAASWLTGEECKDRKPDSTTLAVCSMGKHQLSGPT